MTVILLSSRMDDQADNPNYHLIVYEDLCTDPVQETTRLFKEVDLEIGDQTLAFLNRSLTSHSGDAAYFDVIRNPSEAANRWRNQLPTDVVERVKAQVGKTAPGKLFFT